MAPPRKPAESRFWQKVDKNGPIHPVCGQCWTWMGTVLSNGYGQFKVCGKRFGAHRWTYILLVGSLGGMDVLHRCDNRSCVNPKHLFLGTDQTNADDRGQKGRQAKGENCAAHRLTQGQVNLIRKQYARRSNTRDTVYGIGALARRFGVTLTNIRYIVKRQTWKHC